MISSRTLAAAVAVVAALSACGRRTQPVVAQQGAPLFSNGGFESGTLDPTWTVSVHWNNGITYPPLTYADLKLQPCDGSQPNLTNPKPCVNDTSVKTAATTESQQMTGLSGLASPRWPKFGNASAVVNEQGWHQNVNSLIQRYTTIAADVDPSDGKIHARFALSPQLQNPGHVPSQQPYFYVILRNITKGTTLYQTFNFSNEPGIPWQVYAAATPVLYTDWQVFDVAPGNAALWIGDTIEIEIVAAGCSPNGHWGQVFVDGFGAMLPSLSIAKTAPEWVLADADLTYTFQVENATSLVARNVVASEVIPANTTYQGLSFDPASGITCTTPAAGAAGTGVTGGPTVTCQLGWMNPSSSRTFQVKVHTNAGLATSTVISNGNYWVQGDGINPILGPKVQTSIGNGPFTDLGVTVSDGVPAVVVGDAIHYTITGTNFGPTAVTTATVTDAFPAQLTGVSWTCAGSGGGVCRTPSGSGDLTAANGVASLPVGASAVWTVTATVASLGSGSLANTARVTPAGVTDTNPSNDADTDVDSVGAVHTLTVTKDLAADTGRGQVVSSPVGISCGDSCASGANQFLDGSQVTLTAIARPGDTFAGWGGACTGTGNVCTVQVSADVSVVAQFRGPKVTGSAPGGNGTITCSPSPVLQQTSSTCTIAPAAGYVLTALGDNGADVLAAVSSGAYVLSGAALVNDHEVVGTFMKAPATACTAGGECATGFCADGVCCDGACTGQCQSCSLTGKAGTCSPVSGAPVGGRPACATDGTLCGGSCDGAGPACAYPGTNTSCGTSSCAGGVETNSAACTGSGACGAASTAACSPYVCGATACLASCASDGQCAAGRYCAAGACVAQRTAGQACTAVDQCASGHCVDGVCCDAACDGQCEACDVAGHLGTCSPVTGAPVSPRAACLSDGSACGGACDGTRRTACTYPADGVSCRAASCTGGVATLAASCNGQGACPPTQTQACVAPLSCGATACAGPGSCSSESDCQPAEWCSGGVCVARLAQGASCGATIQCASGHCVDGVCCDAACGGQCEACDVPSFVGTCSPVSGAPQGARPACESDGSACAGACDGSSRTACAYPADTVSCRAASCSGGVATLTASCDGGGHCPAVQTQPCAPFTCGATACAGDCTLDADCGAAQYCSGGVCAPKLAAGLACAAADQCATGHCVDGVCCDAACGGQCEACDVPGFLGTCTATVGAPAGARPACADDGSTCGGACDGSSRTACSYPASPVQCRAPSCAAGVATLSASCDGAGSCPAPQHQSCAPYLCGATACAATCVADAGCAAGDWCSGGVCVPKRGAGQSCSAPSQCASGPCVDGVCCDSACTGQCEACDVAGHVGTCTPVAGAPHGGRTHCASDGTVCGGSCDGADRTACGYPGASTSCRTEFCAAGVSHPGAVCVGSGICPSAAPPVACLSGTCEGAVCAAPTWKLAGSGCSSAGGSSLAPLALIALLLAPLRRRARRRGLLLLALLLLAPAAARAAATDVDVQRFDPSGGAYDLLAIPSARVAGHLATSGGVLGDYGARPLRLVSPTTGASVNLVDGLTTGAVAASVGFLGWSEVSLALPLLVAGSGRPASSLDPQLSGATPASGVGDLRLTPKVCLTPEGSAVAVALVAPVTFPTGSATYLSGHTLAASPRVAAELGSLRGARLLADVGVNVRPARSYAGAEVGTAFVYGVGGELPLGAVVSALATVSGQAGRAADRPLEALAALRVRGPGGLAFTVGGGPGLSRSFGTPEYRVVGAIEFVRSRAVHDPELASAAPARSAGRDVPLPPPPVARPPAVATLSPAKVPATTAPEGVGRPGPSRAPQADPKAILRNNRIVILEPLQFVPGREVVAGASLPLLGEIAALLRAHPEIGRLRIEVHTDDDGTPAQLMERSIRRAVSVRNQLVRGGVEPARLEARGYGDTRPLLTNYTAADRAANRRVEFVVVPQGADPARRAP